VYVCLVRDMVSDSGSYGRKCCASVERTRGRRPGAVALRPGMAGIDEGITEANLCFLAPQTKEWGWMDDIAEAGALC
jgi:hypothetical protein